jgi:hypothetical protein
VWLFHTDAAFFSCMQVSTSKRCAVPSLVSAEPPEITDMRRETMNAFLLSVQARHRRPIIAAQLLQYFSITVAQ